MLKKLTVLSLLIFTLSIAAKAQQDPFVGTWKGNIAKSTYNPGPPPAQGNMTKMEAVPNGLKVTTTNPPNAQGVSTSTEWTAYYDGEDYPMKDTSNAYDSISLKKTGARTLEVLSKKGGKVMRTSQWSVSADNKILTRLSRGTNAQGQPVSSTIVYDKQ
jgi:hypothetical protein